VRRSSGFTLLEVMIAVSVSAIGIVGLLELFSGSVRLASISARQTDALIVARAQMDRSLWDPELEEGEDAGTWRDHRIGGEYRWQVSVEEYLPQLGVPEGEDVEEESTDYELKQITVVVSWDTPGGTSDVSLSTVRLVELF
jgi:prepilin-type N-terminal cleavage/methylation domain-containing protein